MTPGESFEGMRKKIMYMVEDLETGAQKNARPRD
jgi:exonuclease VII small subunit